jgi:hypothetical protein
MRSTSVKVSVSTAIVVVLLAAAPAEAARRTPDRREQQSPRIVHLVRQALARTFGVIAQALPTIPIPGAPKTEETSLRNAPTLPAGDETGS